MRQPFTLTTTLFRRAFDPEIDEMGPDTILFEGCDYKHWLITVDFSKDSNVSREQMIETYVNIAVQVFGSVQEAMKRIYALSTTTYQGFQVECPEETSEKFKSVPQVVFVLPDSYIDPVNKKYGGDKYVNGEIYPRPPQYNMGEEATWVCNQESKISARHHSRMGHHPSITMGHHRSITLGHHRSRTSRTTGHHPSRTIGNHLYSRTTGHRSRVTHHNHIKATDHLP